MAGLLLLYGIICKVCKAMTYTSVMVNAMVWCIILMYYVSYIMYNIKKTHIPYTYYISYIKYQISYILNHMSYIIYHISYIIYNIITMRDGRVYGILYRVHRIWHVVYGMWYWYLLCYVIYGILSGDVVGIVQYGMYIRYA